MSLRPPPALVPAAAATLIALLIATSMALVGPASPAAAATAHPPVVVSLTFDDGTADQQQAADLVAAHGMRATFFVNSGRVGTSGHLTWVQLQALAARGDEIAGHTVDHLDLTALSPDDATREVCNDRVTLLAHGFAIRSFAYPFGANTPSVEQIVAHCGYNSGRDIGGFVSPTSCSACAYAETVPPADRYAIRSAPSVKSTTTLADLELSVTQAEDHGGGWVPMVFHHVCEGTCGTYSTTPELVDQFLTWLQARAADGTTVSTIGDVIGGPVAPAVAGPPSTPTGTPSDSTPPTVRLVGPSDGSTVKGVVALTATATDASGIARLDILVDGKVVCTAVASPLACSWNTAASPDHVAAVGARAVDRAGNTGLSATMTYVVGNSPPSGAAVTTGTHVTLSVARHVVYGRPSLVLVRATGIPDGRPVASAAVTLFFRSTHALRWTRLAVVPTGVDGVARFTPRLTATGILRAYVSGHGSRAAGVAMRPVVVGMYVLLRAPSSVLAGHRATVSVHLLPRHRAQVVVLQLRRGGHWLTVQVRRTDRWGSTAFRLPSRPVGLTGYRVLVSGWGTVAASAAYLSVRTR